MDIKNYKTSSEMIERRMPKINGNNQYKGKTVIALDGGYSAVKGVSPDRAFIFPSYAKKIDKELKAIYIVDSLDIQYRNNKTGEIWLVGQAAQNFMDQTDLESTTDASLYTRYRYDSDVYKTIMSTGLALGCIGANDNEIYLQTGLPATYKDRDADKLIKALAGNYDISIKFGSTPWLDFKFDLPEDHIFVMEQPQGTLCGCTYNKDGVVTNMGKQIITSNTLILDIGFGTEDIFSIKSGYKGTHQTYSDTGMRAVFEETLKEVSKSAPIDIKVFEIQKYLENGELPYFDPDTFSSSTVPFDEILDRKNKELCTKSVKRLMQEYGNLIDYKYLIVTGGTGESRFEQIKSMLSGLDHLQIIPGNMHSPELSFTYSNVLGYYIYRFSKVKKEIKA